MIIAAQIIGGLFLLFLGGEALVRGAVSLAEKLGISTLIIGLTIVAYGTSAPELVVSAQAALKGLPDIALGNIIGSNISNILLVLGISALIFPIKTDAILLKREAPLLLIVTAILIGFAFTGSINMWHGIIFLIITLIYTIYIFSVAKKTGDKTLIQQTEEVEEHLSAKPSYKEALIYLPIGMVMLVYGADILVDGSSTLARLWGISEATIGVTIVAIGSSAPELVTSVIAALKKENDVAIGNIMGSCLFNIMGILGITALIMDVSVGQRFLDYDLWVLFGTTILFLVFMYRQGNITRVEGSIMFALYLAYLGSQVYF